MTGPFGQDPALAQQAATLVARASVMGVLPVGTATTELNVKLLDTVLVGLADNGVAVRQLLRRETETTQSLAATVGAALEQSEHSPMPAGEWPSLLATLDEQLLAQLLGVSLSSVRRYAAGTRPTPQDVADRLHVLALIITDLAGGYNDFGIRRWFTRPRTQLQGDAPVALLSRGWDPEGDAVQRLLELAAGLTGAGAS